MYNCWPVTMIPRLIRSTWHSLHASRNINPVLNRIIQGRFLSMQYKTLLDVQSVFVDSYCIKMNPMYKCWDGNIHPDTCSASRLLYDVSVSILSLQTQLDNANPMYRILLVKFICEVLSFEQSKLHKKTAGLFFYSFPYIKLIFKESKYHLLIGALQALE